MSRRAAGTVAAATLPAAVVQAARADVQGPGTLDAGSAPTVPTSSPALAPPVQGPAQASRQVALEHLFDRQGTRT